MNTKTKNRRKRLAALAALGAVGVGAAVAAVTATSSAAPAYGAVATGGIGTAPDKTLASVIAPDGDRDPFGIALVPRTMGKLTAGNLLVTEFGDRHGAAAAGTTILQVDPATGKTSVFFRGGPVAGPVGVAINLANDGVWVGDYGQAASGTAANDLLIAPNGKVKAVYTAATTHGAASFAGVWGQGVSSSDGTISFYYGEAGNASTGTGGGDVVRLTPHPKGPVNGQPVNATYARIATGQGQTPRGGGAATAAGPQGFAFAADGTLYETNDADNTLYAIPHAATAKSPAATRIIYRGHALHSPENVVIDPRNGDLLVVNATDNRLVVITPAGKLVATRDLAAHQPAGALFGLAIGTNATGDLVLYYTNSNTSTLHELILQAHYAKQ
jgi:sugar lactone lactonase YvrE